MLTIATICARGGSRSVPGKNLRPLAGHPLIAYSIATARSCPFISRVIVSTDSPDIAGTARAYGAEVPFMRPAELATAEAGKIPVLQHAVRALEASGPPLDLIVDLDPTSPLRTAVEVEACWRLAQTAGTDIVFTVTPARKNPYFNMVEIADGYAHLSKLPTRPVVRRQDAPVVYEMNAAIYVWHRRHLLEDGRVVGARSRVVEMPPERSRDIDGELDFDFLEYLVHTGRVRLPDVGNAPSSREGRG